MTYVTMHFCNSSLHIHGQRRGVLNYCLRRNEVRWRPGQEARLAPLCSNLRCFGSTCTALKFFLTLLGLFGALIKIWRPGNCAPCPFVTPLITARSDAPQQIMVHSSNQRHKGTLGFRRGNIFNSPEFLRHFEEKRIL